MIPNGYTTDIGNSYDIRQSVWHVNCCNPELNGGGGWGIFNAVFGWTNSATYGSVLSYNLYWLVVIVAFCSMRYKESKGHLPLMKANATRTDSASQSSSHPDGTTETVIEKKASEDGAATVIREIEG